MEFGAIGITMHVPIGTTSQRLDQEEFPAWQVTAGTAKPTWRMRVEVVFSPDESTSLEQHAVHALGSVTVGGVTSKKMEERFFSMAQRKAMAQWATLTRDTSISVAGWYLVQLGDGIFLTLSVATDPADFAEVESILDRSVETISILDPHVVNDERAKHMLRGKAILAAFTPEKLKAIADGGSQFRRLWQLADDGAEEEIGWVDLSIRTSPRSSAERGGKATSSNAEAVEEGCLVTLVARTIGPEGFDRVETVAHYWVSWDLQSEAWSVRSEQKGSGPRQRFEQIGLRRRTTDPLKPSQLFVATDTGTVGDPMAWTLPSEVYLPQAIALIVGKLLPRNADARGDFAFYCLDPSTNRISQRWMHWAPEGDSSTWVLQAKSNPDAPASREWFSNKGDFIRRQEADGSRMDPTTRADIVKRWNALGLDP